MHKDSEVFLVTFYEKVHKLCDDDGISFQILGKEIGKPIAYATASAWKVRGSIPRPETVKAIADYFHVPVAWLTDDSQDFSFDPTTNPPSDPMLEALLEVWKELDTMGRAELLVRAREIRG